MGENEEEISFSRNGNEYILYKNPDYSKPGLGTIKYKDGGLYAGQIHNKLFEPFGFGVYTLGGQYVCKGDFEIEGKGYGIITNPKSHDTYTGELEFFKPGGLGVKRFGFSPFNDIHHGIIYTGRFTDAGLTLLGISEQKRACMFFDCFYYDRFQGTQTGKSVFDFMLLNGLGVHTVGEGKENDREEWKITSRDSGNFKEGKLNGEGVREKYVNKGYYHEWTYYYSNKFEKNIIDESRTHNYDYQCIYPEGGFSPVIGNCKSIQDIFTNTINLGKKEFTDAEKKSTADDADAEKKSTKFNADDADAKAGLALSLANATPRNVDMSIIGTGGVLKNKYNGTLKKIHGLHPYGYGTIFFKNNQVFTGSYVDNNNMLGKESNNGKIGFFKINNNGDLEFQKDEVKEIVDVVINKALRVKQAIEAENKKKFDTQLEQVKQNIESFNNLKYTQVTAEEGTIQTTNQTTYKGEENKEGLPHGYGRMELKNGSNYEGTFVNGVAGGLGKYTYIVKSKENTYITTYTGEFNNGEPNGSVVIKSGSEYIYEGDVLSIKHRTYVSIRPFGYGTALIGGNRYTGEFKDVHGLTHVVLEDTSTFDGWFGEKNIELGIRTYKNGDVYKGFCKRGQPRGMGVYIKKSGGGSKIWSETFRGDVVPDNGVQNDEMETMIDNAIKEFMNETKLNEVKKKAKEAAGKAKDAAGKAKEAAGKAKDAAGKAKDAAGKAKDAAEPEKADNSYADAIIRATPNGYDAKNVTTFKRPDGGANYVGHVRDGKPFGFGTMTYPNYCTYTGSFINNEPEGLGKIEYLENSGSPLKEYHGFVKGPSPHGYGLGVYKDDGQKEEYHVEWLNITDTVLQSKKEYFDKVYDAKNPELLQKIKINIKRDAEKFVDMVPKVAEEEPSGSAKEESPKSGNLRGKLTPENTLSPQIDPVSTWGKKEYGLAAAAAGIGAAGIYYAFKNSKRKSKSKHRSKSKRRSKRERRSKSKDSSE